ncbi:hypothetical protein BDM02DRAFT_3111513 [Thelephora ganbajun]|uniref:Uncharacterized protein n=1 Tax=Thelephora ganbajun TaxID=370292 RepID=A0ACB6ZM75_THEGA|nr:hypothetical protein BDM02DRAFT_3111513 [Thelephora ganbajun]
MASGSNLRIGMDLVSCTAEVQLADEFTIDGRQVTLIDTPGFDDTNKSDTDILKLIAAFLATTYEAGSKLAGVIYIHRISDRRFTGIAGRNFKMFRELCGDSTLKNVILVTNMWGEVTEDVGEARERELTTNFFKPVLDKGAQLARHRNTAESAYYTIRCIMKNQPTALQIQRELVDEGKDIIDTAAGEAVNKELNEQIRRHQVELKAVQEEMLKALKEKDEETRQELEEETRKLQEQMNRIKTDSEGMASNYQEEKRRMEEAMKQMQEQARQERERAEAAYKKQMDDLNKQLQESASASAAERNAMLERINGLQHQWDNRPRGGGGCLIM